MHIYTHALIAYAIVHNYARAVTNDYDAYT